MPHLDAKHALKQHTRKESRKEKLRKLEECQQSDANKDLLDMDMEALKVELERAQQDFEEQDAICKEFERKIKDAEKAGRKEEERAEAVSRALSSASYKHGILEGKIR